MPLFNNPPSEPTLSATEVNADGLDPDNLVANFRLKFEMYFGFATIFFLFPYSANHLIQGRYAMALLTLAIVILSAVNALLIRRRKKTLLPFAYFYVVILATLVAGLFLQGSTIVFWYYPFAFIVLSIATHKHARIMLLLSAALLIPSAFYAIDLPFAVRFAVTYTMVCILGDIVVGLLDKVQAQQVKLVITDPLTGAYNRRSMLSRLGEAAESCRRGIGSASLIAIDIDNFKKINDSLGHEAGDTALKGLVTTLLQRKRKLDEVFRTGGEEFIVLAHNIEPGQSIPFAESLRAAVEHSEILTGQPITVSIGVVDYANDENIDNWIRRADQNLYEAKARGRNCVWPPYVSSEGLILHKGKKT